MILVATPPAAVAGNPQLNPHLLDLPPNRWVKLHQNGDSGWHRQQHAGLAYDAKRGRLLLFGSDTHGRNWDNIVREFDPVAERWIPHAPPAAPETYAADARGRAVAGRAADQPWAMHSYDNVEYDRHLDALVVSSVPAHNYPAKRAVPQAVEHPTWIYDLSTRRWRMLDNQGVRAPVFFAGASAYDSRRDVLVAYQNGVWELGGARDSWRRVDRGRHHRIHYTMVYDSHRGQFAVFGNRGGDNAVWIFVPPAPHSESGRWERRTPGGDACPADQHLPAAFDERRGVYVLVADNTRTEEERTERRRRPVAESASTFVYDPDVNRYRRLADGSMSALGMNYMMAYDPRHDVFLLVTGNHSEPVTVWALKLDYRRPTER